MSKQRGFQILSRAACLAAAFLTMHGLRAAEVVPGTVDLGFRPELSGSAYDVAALPNGQVVVGGAFLKVNGITQKYVARINEDGSLDESFAPEVSGVVHFVRALADGKILIGGSFNEINGVEQRRLARLNPDGTLDASFAPGLTYEIKAVWVQPDGKIIITQSGQLVRLLTNGTVDPTFNCTISGAVYALAGLPDGRLLIGGTFWAVNGIGSADRLARLNPDGSLDESFQPDVGAGSVRAIAVRDDLSCYVGGTFSEAGGRPQKVAHFLPDGTMDYSFQVTLDAHGTEVLALLAQPNGKLLVGGDFDTVNGVTRHNLVQVNDDGSIDPGFVGTTDASGKVRALATTADGKLLLAGTFDQVDQVAQKWVARLHGEQPSHILQAEIWIAVEIGWNSVAGKHYQVQWADEVDSAFWYDLGEPVEGTGEKMYVFDSVRASGPQKFYRIKVLD